MEKLQHIHKPVKESNTKPIRKVRKHTTSMKVLLEDEVQVKHLDSHFLWTHDLFNDVR